MVDASSFLSTPSARRATPRRRPAYHSSGISIHALREEGDANLGEQPVKKKDFYPRPPRGGRPTLSEYGQAQSSISIHALREEGDRRRSAFTIGIYQFLSTPSARRATHFMYGDTYRGHDFYPRPPRGGRPKKEAPERTGFSISIHALREEGDTLHSRQGSEEFVFLSTPSARRATNLQVCSRIRNKISIHALREEGDTDRATAAVVDTAFLSTPSARRATQVHHLFDLGKTISIHALREEGDSGCRPLCTIRFHFYPRPPRGGRHPNLIKPGQVLNFYPRPPRGGRPAGTWKRKRAAHISIHALREEGDGMPRNSRTGCCYFYPRPPRGGRRI